MARPRRSAAAAPRNPSFKRARKFQPSPPAWPWAGRLVRAVLVLASAVIMVNALFGARGLMSTLRAKQEYATVAARVNQMRSENARLREQVRQLRDDPATIESLARERLGLVYPGETLFIVSTPEPPREPRRREAQRLP
jgi:cell division protein FtsB